MPLPPRATARLPGQPEFAPFDVVQGEPRLIFSITNGSGDVLHGFLELVGPEPERAARAVVVPNADSTTNHAAADPVLTARVNCVNTIRQTLLAAVMYAETNHGEWPARGAFMFSIDRKDFGPGFTFGVATAAYQIEGGQTDGRGSSIWDTFSATPGNVHNGDTGRDACNHYELWPQDLDLIRDGGFDGYRFSFAWPRLIPEGTGAGNQAGLNFYDRLIDGMLQRGIKPYATLYHWDLPSPLQDKGGWMNRDIAGWFADYAALVAQKFGDRLEATATINEPWCVAFLSHILGNHAPG